MFAALLRCVPISRGLPLFPEPDASLVWMYRSLVGEPRANLAKQDGTDPLFLHYGAYPTLLPRVASLLTPERALDTTPADAPLDEQLWAAGSAYRNVRWLSALLSALLVPVAFCVARRFVEKRWALFVAGLSATALLHLAHSSIAKPHAPAATLTWIALLAVLRQIERPSAPRVLVSIAATGLALGALPTGTFVLPAMVVAAVLTPPLAKWTRALAWVAPGIAYVIGLAFVPDGLRFVGEGFVLGHGHTFVFRFFTGGGLRRWPQIFWAYDPTLVLLTACGVLATLPALLGAFGRWRELKPAVVIAVFAVPFCVVISIDERVRDRYLLQLYPVFALLGAWGVRAGTRRMKTALQVTVCAAALAFPTWVAVRFTWLGTQPNTLQRFGDWLRRQPRATEDKVLLSLMLSPPLFPTPAALQLQLATSSGRSQPWFYYLGRHEHWSSHPEQYELHPIDPLLYSRSPPPGSDEIVDYFAREQPAWVAVEVSPRNLNFPGERGIHRVLRERGELVARFTGDEDPDLGPLDYQGVRGLARRALSANSLGPLIEVYRWKSQ